MNHADRIQSLIACAAEGMTVRQAAERLDLTVSAVYAAAYSHKITFARGLRGGPKSCLSADAVIRGERMAAMFRNGYTLQQIGNQYDLTRERVRQIITKHHGLKAEHGGQHVIAERGRRERQSKQDAALMSRCGCTLDQWREMRRIGREMVDAGVGFYRTPLRAYSSQRANAARRGIGWELSLWQWWQIWQCSGKWERRGRGQGYVMCRKGDVGPYSVGNVFIAPATENCSIKPSKKSDLPTGVSLVSGRYAAKRMIAGVILNLGRHKSPELAHAAYLAAAQTSARAA